MPSIFRNNSVPFAIFSAGVLSSAVQCVFLREYLAIFSGNEYIIGVVLATWLCAMGLGSLAGNRAIGDQDVNKKLVGLIALAAAGLYAIRASRLFAAPGEVIGPLPVFLVLTLSEAPFAFASGYLFGSLSRNRLQAPNPYGMESFGALFGTVAVYACVILYAKNVIILALAGAPMLFMLGRKPVFLIPSLAVIAVMFFMNTASMHWKYPFSFSQVFYGQEGEIVRVENATDTAYLLNGTMYKSTAQKQFLEQAVHIPLATRNVQRNVLIIFDKGHSNELKKYPGITIDCIESEPRIASLGSILAAPESFDPKKRYDAIFLGSGIPQTAATGRLYTVSFFQKMKTILTDSGIFSCTLPFSENYLSTAEKRMNDVLKSTLLKVFNNILVFPGNGYTFMASEKAMNIAAKPRVKTDYLETSIVPSVSAERIAAANGKPSGTAINTAEKPISLLLGLALWIDPFKGTFFIVAALFGIFFFACIIVLPKSKEALSLGSTGFAVGVYSVALLLLYQSTYGLLYSRVSLLLCSLTCGFICGTLVKRLPQADLFIGAYCLASLGMLSVLPYPPAILFYCAHLGAGVLAGAQFVSMKKASAGTLYAADCVGGAAGMACSIAGIAFFGIINVAVGLCAIKSIVWLIGGRK